MIKILCAIFFILLLKRFLRDYAMNPSACFAAQNYPTFQRYNLKTAMLDTSLASNIIGLNSFYVFYFLLYILVVIRRNQNITFLISLALLKISKIASFSSIQKNSLLSWHKFHGIHNTRNK